jgi:hypothetical protein
MVYHTSQMVHRRLGNRASAMHCWRERRSLGRRSSGKEKKVCCCCLCCRTCGDSEVVGNFTVRVGLLPTGRGRARYHGTGTATKVTTITGPSARTGTIGPAAALRRRTDGAVAACVLTACRTMLAARGRKVRGSGAADAVRAAAVVAAGIAEETVTETGTEVVTTAETEGGPAMAGSQPGRVRRGSAPIAAGTRE